MQAASKRAAAPREHGAWFMLLLPFVAALLAAGDVRWPVVPALAAALGLFLARDPVLVLLRQRFVWRGEHEQTRSARRVLAWCALPLALCGALLVRHAGLPTIAAFAAGGMAFLVIAAAVSLKNRQRSVWFQAVTAGALSSSALLASVAVTGTVQGWSVLLWLMYWAHSAAAVFAVHARIAARVAWRSGRAVQTLREFRDARLAQAALLSAAAGCVFAGRPWMALPLLFSAVAHLVEIQTAMGPRAAETPLRTVGFRAVGTSVVFTVLLLVALRR